MPRLISRVCVYCGSAWGLRPIYREAAADFGRCLAEAKMELVFGGGKLGLMGAVADAAIAAGGRVTGVITHDLKHKEVAHDGLNDLQVVQTMHERKKSMADLADAFVALPGGVGTLDELFEMMAWSQLEIHDCPIGVLNTNGYFNSIIAFLDHAAAEGFLRVDPRRVLIVESEPARLLSALQNWTGMTRKTWERAPRT